MVVRLIDWCARNRALVLLAAIGLSGWGAWTMLHTPLDAVPDISDVQVIVATEWMGRSPDLVEDQVTYPLVTALLSTPHVKAVRGFTDFGISYVYVIFDDGTDIYWARSRVVEYLQGIRGQLPSGVNPTIGPDATGVGWVFQYALVDDTGRHTLADLRSFQDWYLRYWLAKRAGRGGSREHRRVREAVPGDARSRAPRVVSRRPERRGDGHPGQQQRRRRPPAGVLRARVHGARPRIPEIDRRHRAGGRDAADRRVRHARARARRGDGRPRPGAPAGRGRARRTRRGRRRHRRHALRRERAWA